MAEMILDKSITGHASSAVTVKMSIPPMLAKAAVLGGRVTCITASTAAAKTILIQKGTGSSAVTVLTFTTPSSAGVGTIISGVRATTNPVTTFSAASAVNIVSQAGLGSKVFDVRLVFDDKAILKP